MEPIPNHIWHSCEVKEVHCVADPEESSLPSTGLRGSSVAADPPLREAFPFDQAQRYLLRDRDGIFGFDFTQHVKALAIKEVLSAARSPWQRAFVERVIGTIRPGVARSSDRLKRGLAPSDAIFVFRVLSRGENAFVAWQRRPESPVRASDDAGASHCHSAGGLAASLVRAPRRLTFARTLSRSGPSAYVTASPFMK